MRETAVKSGGASGEPSKSSAEKGRIYHTHLVNNLVKVINRLKTSDDYAKQES